MDNYDLMNVKRIVEWIVDNADYSDLTELTKELGVNEEWFEQFMDEDEEEEEWY